MSASYSIISAFIFCILDTGHKLVFSTKTKKININPRMARPFWLKRANTSLRLEILSEENRDPTEV
jgi:hypothetical protein